MKAQGLLFAAALLPLSASAAEASLTGLWDAKVTVNEVEVPFRFEIENRNGEVAGWFFNGEERVRSTAGNLQNGTLTLRFEQYATVLQVSFAEGRLAGTYGRKGRPPYAFEARPFQPVSAPAEAAPSIAGQWEIGVKSPKGESAWKLFVRQSGTEVTAAILRVDGDTGTLSGAYRGGKFVLSHFSGARPSLVELTPQADGSLAVVQNRKSAYTAVRVADARAKGLPEPADPSRWTSVADPSQPLRFEGRDLNGATVASTDPRFQGKVVLLNITGSWCPNCHDEAPFLAELYRKYRGQGLEIVALSFEEAEQLNDPTRLRAFIRNYGIEYPVLLGGEPDDLKQKLPQAVNLNTWPATFFIGRDGLVRGAHAGFAGKATGEEHNRVKEEFVGRVEKLLAENIRTAR